jgi:hypothetical protein
MRQLFLFYLPLFLFANCKKENDLKVEIYLLDKFTLTNNLSTNPVTQTVTNASLASQPLVADNEIAWYQQSTTTFKLKKDIRPRLQNLGPDKAFAVTVNGDPVYYGRFHPGYMSSLVFGLATIDPISVHNNELTIYYVSLSGDPQLQALDKRNNDRLVKALQANGRLR